MAARVDPQTRVSAAAIAGITILFRFIRKEVSNGVVSCRGMGYRKRSPQAKAIIVFLIISALTRTVSAAVDGLICPKPAGHGARRLLPPGNQTSATKVAAPSQGLSRRAGITLPVFRRATAQSWRALPAAI